MKGSDMLNVIGWSRSLLIRFGIVAAFIALVPLVLKLLLGLDVLVGLTAVTALILLAYTIETQALRHEVVRQNEIAIQPVLIATTERRDGRPRVVLRNIGRGTALFVQPKDVTFPGDGEVVVTASFGRVDYIRPDEDSVVLTGLSFRGPEGDVFELHRDDLDHHRRQGPNRLGDDPFAYHLDPENAPRTYEVVIAYEDISGGQRESVMQMGKGGIRLVKHGKTTT